MENLEIFDKNGKTLRIAGVMGSSNIEFTKDELINFAKYVWYTKDIKDSSKGLVHFFDEWIDIGKNYCP